MVSYGSPVRAAICFTDSKRIMSRMVAHHAVQDYDGERLVPRLEGGQQTAHVGA